MRWIAGVVRRGGNAKTGRKGRGMKMVGERKSDGPEERKGDGEWRVKYE